MAKTNIGPVVLSITGDSFSSPARISGIIWEGATTAGDTVELKCRDTGAILWVGRTDSTNTYIGVSLPVEGIHAPFGFVVTKISAGRLLVYLREN